MIHKLDDKIIGRGEVKGFEFIKIFENDKGYIFKVTGGKSLYYEVFYKKTTPICIDFKNRIYSETELKEIYPKAKDFGIWAWTTNNIENAKKIIQ